MVNRELEPHGTFGPGTSREDTAALLPLDVIEAYEAPFLIEKLVTQAIVDSPRSAELLFRELKRFLVLAHLDGLKTWTMYSLQIDEVWHQFVLYTIPYAEFCATHFGRFLDHGPWNDPNEPPARTFQRLEAFARRYEQFFGEPLPELWNDAYWVALDKRLIYKSKPTKVRCEGGTAQLVLADDESTVLVSVDDWALSVVEFLAHQKTFFVRELPSILSPADKVALCTELVRKAVFDLCL